MELLFFKLFLLFFTRFDLTNEKIIMFEVKTKGFVMAFSYNLIAYFEKKFALLKLIF